MPDHRQTLYCVTIIYVKRIISLLIYNLFEFWKRHHIAYKVTIPTIPNNISEWLFERIRANKKIFIHTDPYQYIKTYSYGRSRDCHLPMAAIGKGRSEVARFLGWNLLSFQHLSNVENHVCTCFHHPNGKRIILLLMPSAKLFKNSNVMLKLMIRTNKYFFIHTDSDIRANKKKLICTDDHVTTSNIQNLWSHDHCPYE